MERPSALDALMVARPSPEMSELLARMAAEDGDLPDATTLPAEEGRAQTARVHQRWRQYLPVVGGVLDFMSTNADGGAMRCRRIDPPEASQTGAILFIHGGGWAFCDIDTHEDGMRRLSIASSMPVFACDYRLAPEFSFPIGLNDCIAFWRHLRCGALPGGPVKGPLFIAGDSAGANLALALTLSEAADGLATPDGALLIYGVYGTDFETRSYRDHADGPGLTRDKMRRFWDWYCPEDQRNSFRAAPLAATDEMIRGLPPLIIAAAEIDPLFSDSRRLIKRCKVIGRRDQFQLLPGLAHGAIQMGGWLPSAANCIDELGEALQNLRNSALISNSAIG